MTGQIEKKFMKRYIKIAIVILLILSLYTCVHRHQSNKAQQTTQVKAEPVNAVLYYSGIIAPLKTIVITSPTEGVINDMSFNFGDAVKQGDSLFLISSDKFQADYKLALMQYIKTKTDYMNAQSQQREGEFLHQNKLISDDEYKAKQTSFYNARLTMLQAKDVLDNLQRQIDLQGVNLYNLKIEDVDKITQVLHEQNALRQIHIVSTASGVVLLPNKNESGDGELKKIAKGDTVKQGDVLAVIGDISGLKLHIKVSEFNVNQLKLGQKVKVTGAAFPDDVLEGKISAINHQGEVESGGLPVFPVEVVVPTLTRAQQTVIHMGMSAKVAIEMDDASKLTVPIKAIIQKNGNTYVNVKDQKSGQIREVPVKTGETTLDSVVIASNLKPGEQVVFTD